MNGEKKIIYFDACIFIAWLKNEKRPDSTDMQAVQEIVERVQKREITIITSTITQTEVAACKVGKGALTTFDDYLISLSGNVGGYSLKIQKPPIEQLRLFS